MGCADHLYVAGYGDDSVAVFTVQADGTLEFETSLAAGQLSNAVASFSRDAASGSRTLGGRA